MQAEIFDLVLDRINVLAVLSLEAVMHVAAALARDLQQDFLQYLPRFLTALTKLMSEGAYRFLLICPHTQGSIMACTPLHLTLPVSLKDCYVEIKLPKLPTVSLLQGH